MSQKRNKKVLIHLTANCEDCNWKDEGYMTGAKSARLHAKKTGHTVSVETGYWMLYNPKNITD